VTLNDQDTWIYAMLWRMCDPERPLETCGFTPTAPSVFRRFLTIARVHRVLGIVLEKLHPLSGSYPQEWAAGQQCWRGEIVRSLRLRQHSQMVMGAITAADIPAMLFKGIDFAGQLYSNTRFRPTFDVDILVPREHWTDAARVLETTGHIEKSDQPPMQFPSGLLGERTWLHASGMEIEVDLHWNLINLPWLRHRASIEWRDLNDQTTARLLSAQGQPTNALRLLIAAIHATYHHQFDRLLLLTDILQACRRVEQEGDVAAIRHFTGRTGTRKALDLALVVTAKCLEVPEVERMRQRIAGGTRLPEIPAMLLTDIQRSLCSIRCHFNSPYRRRIRQWLDQVE
jgi:hypothetical protein